MSDEIGKVIRRDLDRLPVLPAERWFPTASPASSSAGRLARRGLLLVVVALFALAAGVSLARVRLERDPGSAASAPPPPAGVSIPSTISREQAIALVRGTSDVGRVDRIEAKLLSFDEYLRVAGRVQFHSGDPQASAVSGFGITGDPAKRYIWAVAVSGEVWPNGRTPIYWGGPPPVPNPTPYPPYRWGIFLVDAVPGQLMAMGDAGVADSWPAAFDKLPDHPVATYVAPSPIPLASPLRVGVRGPEAMAAVIRLGAEVRRIDRIELKLMTQGEFERAQPSGMTSFDETAPVWVVAVAGEITPQFSRGASFASATYLVDATTGSVIGMSAGGDPWPTYFDGLPNHGTQ